MISCASSHVASGIGSSSDSYSSWNYGESSRLLDPRITAVGDVASWWRARTWRSRASSHHAGLGIGPLTAEKEGFHLLGPVD